MALFAAIASSRGVPAPAPLPQPAGWARPPVGQVLLSPPHLTGGEMAALEAALGSGWLAPAGPVPAAFEAALSGATGFAHVLATASGTAALHLGYRCLGVSAGDEVWTSALTFVATVAPAVQMGATPRFLDVEPGSWTLDPDLLERELARAGRAGRLPRARGAGGPVRPVLRPGRDRGAVRPLGRAGDVRQRRRGGRAAPLRPPRRARRAARRLFL